MITGSGWLTVLHAVNQPGSLGPTLSGLVHTAALIGAGSEVHACVAGALTATPR